ncbi:MAG: hypothetical protein DCF15_22785 [Phormidesmis priestleyi]|uniref:CopG family transcriptional regulator n=1 Tax=Phormidesmis priestleyi TaxID=268141 RepID=A0A2W4WD80_9CYAN|nr:MAG: hypothetical protein DCF15_22785 [Phormidesmis priestleyi]
MKITIDLSPALERSLNHQAEQQNVPLQILILKALSNWISTSENPSASERQSSKWPETILAYKGEPDFPAFEAYRQELSPLKEPELF